MPKPLEASPKSLRAYRHRLSQAEHRPERPCLWTSDVARLLTMSATAVTDRDAELKPADLGLRGKKARRYSLASVLAYQGRDRMVPATA